jgi:Ca2+-binding EF-hand superfamily protein
MGKKKRKGRKKKKSKFDPNAPPPIDPLSKLSKEEMAVWKDMFDMMDIEKKGTLNGKRITEIIGEMSEGKVDANFVDHMVTKFAVKKEEGMEHKPDEVNYLNFM